eukprot:2631506-Amphidinium_carterae.2
MKPVNGHGRSTEKLSAGGAAAAASETSCCRGARNLKSQEGTTRHKLLANPDTTSCRSKDHSTVQVEKANIEAQSVLRGAARFGRSDVAVRCCSQSAHVDNFRLHPMTHSHPRTPRGMSSESQK